MKTLDFFCLVIGNSQILQRDVAFFKGNAPAKRVGNGAWLLVDLLEHEVAEAPLLRRHGIPGYFFYRSLDFLALAIE